MLMLQPGQFSRVAATRGPVPSFRPSLRLQKVYRNQITLPSGSCNMALDWRGDELYLYGDCFHRSLDLGILLSKILVDAILVVMRHGWIGDQFGLGLGSPSSPQDLRGFTYSSIIVGSISLRNPAC